MVVRRQTEDEIEFETPHQRVGSITRPIVSVRRGTSAIEVRGRSRGGEVLHLPLSAVEAVRLVPEASGGFHRWRSGGQRWTLAVRFRGGEDLLLERRLAAGEALELARALCRLGGLRQDEATRRLFGVADEAPSEEL